MSEAATEPTPAPEEEKVEQSTAYVILGELEAEPQEGDANRSTWYVLATVNGRSAKAAIRSWLDQGPDEPKGTYVAVPARSWQPITVSTETQKRIKLS